MTASPRRTTGVERLFGITCRAYELVGPGDPASLAPAEAEAVSRARPRRRAEFAAGRACARAAIAAWGLPPEPVTRGSNRAPCWPPGVLGSISHTRGYAVAVVARREPTAGAGSMRVHNTNAPPGLGVDAERVGRLGTDLHRRLFTESEQAWLSELPPEAKAPAAAAAFAAKEAFYKAQHPVTGAWVGFLDVAVRPLSAGFAGHPGRRTHQGLELVPATRLPALAAWHWPVAAPCLLDGELVVAGVTARPAVPP